MRDFVFPLLETSTKTEHRTLTSVMFLKIFQKSDNLEFLLWRWRCSYTSDHQFHLAFCSLDIYLQFDPIAWLPI